MCWLSVVGLVTWVDLLCLRLMLSNQGKGCGVIWDIVRLSYPVLLFLLAYLGKKTRHILPSIDKPITVVQPKARWRSPLTVLPIVSPVEL